MKVLFLDIDGVLNSVQAVHMYHRRNKDTIMQEWNPYEEFCPLAVNNLVEVLEAVPTLKIVVSSTWRMGCTTVEDLQALFDVIPESHGRKVIQDRIIDRTPSFRKGPRGDEIKAWLERPASALVTTYAIVDDDGDMLTEQRPNFFQTNGYLGLMWDVGDKIINHFGGKRV